MKKYQVTFYRSTRTEVTDLVEANSEAEAIEKSKKGQYYSSDNGEDTGDVLDEWNHKAEVIHDA